MYITVMVIGARILFRLIEYSDGLYTAIPRQEVYQYCFDSPLMLIASTMFNASHPSALMPGKAGDMPTRKEKKKAGKGSVDHILLGSQRTSVV
ncbi:hypothetical protein DL98DRAFT_522439 [Cadophora sp. DSE1049]|nr:hypothetical protein DL98DRAFT_522439 [Cadophora sp. DSE1049]